MLNTKELRKLIYQKKIIKFYEFIKLSLSLYVQNKKIFLAIILLVSLPLSILTDLIFIKPIGFHDYVFSLWGWIYFFIKLLLSVLVFNIALLIVKNSILSVDIKLDDLIKKSLVFLFPASIATFLVLLISGFGLVFWIIPGVIIFIYMIFVQEAIVLSQKNVIESLKYSFKIVRGFWWKVFGFFLGISVLMSVIQLLVFILFNNLAKIFDHVIWLGLIQLMYSMFITYLSLYMFVAFCLLYLNLEYIAVNSRKVN